MIQIDAAAALSDLAIPPANRLQLLNPSSSGQYSIRVNKQYRITFVWSEDGHAEDVNLIDYH